MSIASDVRDTLNVEITNALRELDIVTRRPASNRVDHLIERMILSRVTHARVALLGNLFALAHAVVIGKEESDALARQLDKETKEREAETIALRRQLDAERSFRRDFLDLWHNYASDPVLKRILVDLSERYP